MSSPFETLSRRERQVMELIFASAPISVSEIEDRMEDPPTNSAVRSILRSLTRKGMVKIEKDGVRHLYRPIESTGTTGQRALRHAVGTFFQGSVTKAVSALLASPPTEEELARLRELIDEAEERRGRRG